MCLGRSKIFLCNELILKIFGLIGIRYFINARYQPDKRHFYIKDFYMSGRALMTNHVTIYDGTICNKCVVSIDRCDDHFKDCMCYEY